MFSHIVISEMLGLDLLYLLFRYSIDVSITHGSIWNDIWSDKRWEFTVPHIITQHHITTFGPIKRLNFFVNCWLGTHETFDVTCFSEFVAASVFLNVVGTIIDFDMPTDKYHVNFFSVRCLTRHGPSVGTLPTSPVARGTHQHHTVSRNTPGFQATRASIHKET